MLRPTTLLGSLVFFVASAARADDTIDLEPEPQQQQQQQPAQSQKQPRAFVPPSSLEEYRARKTELRLAFRDAREHRDPYAEESIRSTTVTLDEWYRANTHMNNPGMFIAGIATMSIGGAGLIVGSTMIAVGLSQACVFCTSNSSANTLFTAGLVVGVAGVVVGVIGIPITVVGHRRELGPEVSLFVGPTSGIQGTF